MKGDPAVASLISDLYWQMDQLRRRGIKDNGGKPYIPSYYKRGLQNAMDRGDSAVVDYVRHYLYKPPSDGYRKLEEANSLDLTCEALVADESRTYARLFTDADREAARTRLKPHQDAIDRRKAAILARVAQRRSELPQDLALLREIAMWTSNPEEAIAVNARILVQAPHDTAALNRLGRAYEQIGAIDEAMNAFAEVIAIDPANQVAARRQHALNFLRK